MEQQRTQLKQVKKVFVFSTVGEAGPSGWEDRRWEPSKTRKAVRGCSRIRHSPSGSALQRRGVNFCKALEVGMAKGCLNAQRMEELRYKSQHF